MAQEKQKAFEVEVRPLRCKACGYCREVCPRQVFEPSEQPNAQGYQPMLAVRCEKCIGCLQCLMICPDFAITVTEK